jgi:ankyrin repeat protein
VILNHLNNDIINKQQYYHNLLKTAILAKSIDFFLLISKFSYIDLNDKDKDGYTPLMNAIAFGEIEITHYLLSQKVNMRAVDNNGNNILT